MSAPSRKADSFPRPVVRSRWFDTSTVGGIVFAESLTKQEFKDECDINIVLSRYKDHPPRAWGNPPTLRFGDFADAPEFLEAQLLVKEAEETFRALPVQVRDRFGFDPAKFLAFAQDPANIDEARRLGLAVAPPPVSIPPVTPDKGTP